MTIKQNAIVNARFGALHHKKAPSVHGTGGAFDLIA
jgi:hypothetical protein